MCHLDLIKKVYPTTLQQQKQQQYDRESYVITSLIHFVFDINTSRKKLILKTNII